MLRGISELDAPKLEIIKEGAFFRSSLSKINIPEIKEIHGNAFNEVLIKGGLELNGEVKVFGVDAFNPHGATINRLKDETGLDKDWQLWGGDIKYFNVPEFQFIRFANGTKEGTYKATVELDSDKKFVLESTKAIINNTESEDDDNGAKVSEGKDEDSIYNSTKKTRIVTIDNITSEDITEIKLISRGYGKELAEVKILVDERIEYKLSDDTDLFHRIYPRTTSIKRTIEDIPQANIPSDKIFLGWSESKNATTVDYAVGDTINRKDKTVLYAVFANKPTTTTTTQATTKPNTTTTQATTKPNTTTTQSTTKPNATTTTTTESTTETTTQSTIRPGTTTQQNQILQQHKRQQNQILQLHNQQQNQTQQLLLQQKVLQKLLHNRQ